MSGEIGHGAAVHLPRHFHDQFLCQLHQVMIVCVRLVELEHGEFGIVLGRNTFITKVAVDFVDAVEPTHNQPFQVELRRDTQVEGKIQRIMVGAKGPGGGSPGDRLHHRRLHLDVSALVKKMPDRLKYLGSFDENRAHIGVHEQIDVTLPVAKFNVSQAVVFLRECQHRLG